MKEDFLLLRKTLETKHPRLYEYTSKEQFNLYFDSLYQSIDQPLTEREFHFFLMPIVNLVHCSHTKLMSSQYLLDHMDEYIKAPPLQIYFTPEKAYIVHNFSSDTSVKAGAALLSVNGIPADDIRKNFLARMTQEGNNTTFLYNRLNTAAWPANGYAGLFPGICDYPVVDSYKIEYVNPGTQTKKNITLASLAYGDYPPALRSGMKKIEFKITGNRIAILTLSSFSIPYNQYKPFIDSVFTLLKSREIPRLIIDLRGNLGGIPQETVGLLSYLLPQPFIYFKEGNGYDEYKASVPISPNRFTGKVYFLIDGACRSSTGHFLALAKYYRIGTMIGEETCASYSCNDNGHPYTLPHTKLILQCSESTYTVAVSGLQRGSGIHPDYTVVPSVNSIIAGRDTVMQFALEKAGE